MEWGVECPCLFQATARGGSRSCSSVRLLGQESRRWFRLTGHFSSNSQHNILQDSELRFFCANMFSLLVEKELNRWILDMQIGNYIPPPPWPCSNCCFQGAQSSYFGSNLPLVDRYPFLFTALPNLETLKLTWNPELEWELADLAGLVAKLKELNCPHNRRLTEKLRDLVHLKGILVKLNLHTCRDLTGSLADIYEFFVAWRGLPLLTQVSLSIYSHHCWKWPRVSKKTWYRTRLE